MKSNGLLFFKSKVFVLRLVILGLISAGVNLGILAMINLTLKNRLAAFPSLFTFYLFFTVVGVCFAATLYFQNMVTAVANQVLFDLELSIIQKVKNSTFVSYRRLGSEKIYTALREAEILGKLPDALIGLINSSIMIVCGLGYLFWISPSTTLFVVAFMTAFFLLNIVRSKAVEPRLEKAIDYQNNYYSAIDDLLYGFKQLKVSQTRAEHLFENHILRNREESKKLLTDAMKVYNSIRLSGSYSWFVVIGFTVIAFSTSEIDKVQIASLLTTILFLISPASSLVSIIPLYGQAKVAYEHIRNVENALVPTGSGQASQENEFDFRSIRFENVVHTYGLVEDDHFLLDLENMVIERGEILFITGANGSGKTTFLNIFTGLISPQQGKVFVNEEQLSWDDYRRYANNMAIIFSDQFLFKNVVDDNNKRLFTGDFESYVQLLNLNEIAGDMAEPGAGGALSKGQQKRLQLLYAICENKQILVLDEWAAEQDSANKTLFYCHWLEFIRAKGISIIVISHDDDFFYKADRVVTFEQGRIVSKKLHPL